MSNVTALARAVPAGTESAARAHRPLRFVTAASLFDGHDAAINMIRRLLQTHGAEVVHLGHNRSVAEIVRAAIQEDADAVAVSSYQGGHNEYFAYMVDMLREKGVGHIRVIVGGGGTIAPHEVDALHKHGVSDANLTWLAEAAEADPERIDGRSTKEGVAKAFADLAARIKTTDDVFVILIGHGSFNGRVASFNLPGPDLTAEEYGELLGKLPSNRVAFVNTAGASGAFLASVTAPGRAVVTARSATGFVRAAARSTCEPIGLIATSSSGAWLIR